MIVARTFSLRTRLMACACIFSRAAELQKVRNPWLVPQAARYAQRVLRLLHEAEESPPEKERETFWA